MKRTIFYILLILPILFSFQCEEDINEDLFQTNLVITNNSSIDLVLETDNNIISTIETQDSQYIEGYSSEAGFAMPSDIPTISSIKMYSRDENQNLILVYDQSPLVDNLWIINESTTMDVDHVLVITDEDLIE
jgi:hypothetical protein